MEFLQTNKVKILPSRSEAIQLCSLTHCSRTMHLPWILRLFNILSILYSLCILSSANLTSFPLATGTARNQLHLTRRSHPLDSSPAFPNTQPISKRSSSNGVSYNFWDNGWTSRSYTFVKTRPPKKPLTSKNSPTDPNNLPVRPRPRRPRRRQALHPLRPHLPPLLLLPTHPLRRLPRRLQRHTRKHGAVPIRRLRTALLQHDGVYSVELREDGGGTVEGEYGDGVYGVAWDGVCE